jgi:hypothetical protein
VNTNLFRIFIVYICIAVGDQIMKWRRVGMSLTLLIKKKLKIIELKMIDE